MKQLRTPLCDRLGIEVPVVQAPVGSVSCPELAAAVSDAGGLGTLAVTWRDFDETREVIAETRERTDAPFAVNLVLDDDGRTYPTDDHLDVCLDAGADLVSVSFGDATEYVDRVHDAGGKVLWTVSDADEARTAVTAGADVLVAQGWEAGGHVQGEVATMPLVPEVVDAAAEADVPVVAAGGIGDGRGVAAALALGADGAWLGTRFVATEEANAHRRYREAVVEGDTDETQYGEVFDREWPGTPHRTLTNSTVEAAADAEESSGDGRPGRDDTVAVVDGGPEIPRYSGMPPLPEMAGDLEALALYAGQSVGRTEGVQPAADVVADIVAETHERLDALQSVRG